MRYAGWSTKAPPTARSGRARSCPPSASIDTRRIRRDLVSLRSDLRQLTPMVMSEHVHDVAMTIFNRHTTRGVDLTEDDVADVLAPLDVPDQMTVFVALFCMYGTKVGAMKTATGIE